VEKVWGFWVKNIYSLCLSLGNPTIKNNKEHELKNCYIIKRNNTKKQKVSVITTKAKTTTKQNNNPKKINQTIGNMLKNLPLVFKLVLKFQASICTWQGQGKYHIN